MPEDWADRAECRGIRDTSIFFPEIERGNCNPAVWNEARSICERCGVRVQCLESQMPFEEITGRRDGMWGGLTPKERDALAYERQRPRL